MKTNVAIALTITILLTLWMVFGPLFAQQETPAASTAEETKLPSVRVRDSHAESFAATLTLRGKTEAARSSLLRAEVSGQIQEIVAQRGATVKAGDVLVRIDPQNLPERLEASKALVAQRNLEFEAARKLQSSGFQSETRLSEASALLAQAKDQLATTRIALENCEIRAPFSGVFNERLVEVGEYVSPGDAVAHFLELSPMIVTAEATELEVQRIHQGDKAKALIGQETIEGTIRYISRSANEAVRTYTVELEFKNPGNKFQAGLTADILAQTDSEMAHKVTPAILFLSSNTEGDLGLKTVESDSTVSFHRVEIIGTEPDGVWVSGLPEYAKIITVGQGFVVPGAKVEAVEDSTIQ